MGGGGGGGGGEGGKQTGEFTCKIKIRGKKVFPKSLTVLLNGKGFKEVKIALFRVLMTKVNETK